MIRRTIQQLPLAALLLLSATAFAQTPVPAVTAPACPSARTLDELIKAVDNAVSGPADKDRTCLRDVLLPEARLTVLNKIDEGKYEPHIMSIDDWIQAVKKRGSDVFYEKQIKYSSDMFAHMAQVWSVYEIRKTPDGAPQVRGVNSFQAINDGKRWRVLSILWQVETKEEMVPVKYLP